MYSLARASTLPLPRFPCRPGWAEVHVGPTSACAVARSSLAYCWGLNDQGALGNGTASAPGEVVADARLVGGGRILFNANEAAISVGDGFACGMGSYVAESPDGIQWGPTHLFCWVGSCPPWPPALCCGHQ